MCTRDLPDLYALSPRATAILIIINPEIHPDSISKHLLFLGISPNHHANCTFCTIVT